MDKRTKGAIKLFGPWINKKFKSLEIIDPMCLIEDAGPLKTYRMCHGIDYENGAVGVEIVLKIKEFKERNQ